jgi:hypothetical protein
VFERRLPNAFRQRDPDDHAWAGYDAATVSTLLDLLACAFIWKTEDARRLRPDDELWPIYWTYYPQTHWWQRMRPDQCEMELLFVALRRHNEAIKETDLSADRHANLTIGDIVRLMRG